MSSQYQRTKVTKSQLEKIINFMECNPDLNKAALTGSFTAKVKNEKWSELTKVLNEDGGCIKSTSKWQRCWCDYKVDVKKRFRKYMEGTGGGPGPKVLSDLDLRVLEILGSDAYEGLQVKENIPQTFQDMKTEDTQANGSDISSVSTEETTQRALNSEGAIIIQSVNTEKIESPCTSIDQALTFTKPTSHVIVPTRRKRFSTSSASEYANRNVNRIRYLRSDESKPKSHDEFEYFGQNIACQLRQLPLEVALQCQSDIFSLVQKRRIECLHRGMADVSTSEHALLEDQSNSSNSLEVD